MQLLHGSIDQARYCAFAAITPSSVQHEHKRALSAENGNKARRSEYERAHIMAFLTETIRRNGPISAIRDAIVGLADTWNRYVVYRKTYEELSALSTRELQDLGIARSMITRLAYESAYGKNA